MASPYQQQAQRRKLIYIGSILVLFTVAFLWRSYAVASQAQSLGLREVDQGEVELTGSVIRLGLTGSHGLVTCGLWMTAIEKQRKNQWNELELYVRWVTKLQPHFVTPWLFQSWNLAYNVSVESDRVNDKYFYITRGIQLLAEGERQNRDNPDLRYWIGFYHQHKICKSDETNVQRSLFQLSLIPPNERDPARFKKINPATNREEIDLEGLEDFCKKHPQLARRLREGMMRDTKGEHFRQFTCATAADVVRFLADNQRLPSPYEDAPIVAVGSWQPRNDDKLRPPAERFPPLPPKRDPAPPQRIFDPKEWTADQITQLGDDIDAYAIARAWYAYAQEPIPDPDDYLPGATKEITDRAHQRKPKQITTIIFRNHPALAESDIAQRLQQEGWFDNAQWQITDWFPRDRFRDGTPAVVGNDRFKWSQEAWADAHDRWRRHGEANHLLVSQEAAANLQQLADQFNKEFGVEGVRPPNLRVESMDPITLERYRAAQFIFEYGWNRNVSNFPYHYERSGIEALEDTVEGRKQFYSAERHRWNGKNTRSLEEYAKALLFWRDKVFLKNKFFRRDPFTQEESFDWQYRYLRLWHEENGRDLKLRVGALARVVPLVPPVNDADYPGWMIQGPFDGEDEEGPLIGPEERQRVLMRKPGAPVSRGNPAPQQPANAGQQPTGQGQQPKGLAR
jgi:hypothetical protein